MMINIYRCWVDGLSFERTGPLAAVVEVPDGSSTERSNGLWNFREGRLDSPCGPVLMVPSEDDPKVRYAWSAVDVVNDCRDSDSRFVIVHIEDADRNAIAVGAGVN